MGLFNYLGMGSMFGGGTPAIGAGVPDLQAGVYSAGNAATALPDVLSTAAPTMGTGFSAGSVIDPKTGVATGQNIWGESLAGDVGNIFGSKEGNRHLMTGLYGANTINQMKTTNDATDLMKQQQALSQDAYYTDKTNQQQTEQLNF